MYCFCSGPCYFEFHYARCICRNVYYISVSTTQQQRTHYPASQLTRISCPLRLLNINTHNTQDGIQFSSYRLLHNIEYAISNTRCEQQYKNLTEKITKQKEGIVIVTRAECCCIDFILHFLCSLFASITTQRIFLSARANWRRYKTRNQNR